MRVPSRRLRSMTSRLPRATEPTAAGSRPRRTRPLEVARVRRRRPQGTGHRRWSAHQAGSMSRSHRLRRRTRSRGASARSGAPRPGEQQVRERPTVEDAAGEPGEAREDHQCPGPSRRRTGTATRRFRSRRTTQPTARSSARGWRARVPGQPEDGQRDALAIAAASRADGGISNRREEIDEGSDTQLILGDEMDRRQLEEPGAIRRGAPGGREQHRRWVASLEQAASHVEPVDVRQPDVEQDEIGVVLLEQGERGSPSAASATTSRPPDTARARAISRKPAWSSTTSTVRLTRGTVAHRSGRTHQGGPSVGGRGAARATSE